MSSTHVVKIPTRRKNDPAIFPAWERNDGLLVDLRLFPADVVTTSRDKLVFRPSVLERDGIDPAILAVAARERSARLGAPHVGRRPEHLDRRRSEAEGEPVIEVAYTPSEGIVVRGTERAHAPALKKTTDRLKWYGTGGFWYVPRTRDTVQARWRVDRIAEELRRNLPTVSVAVSFELGDGVRPAEELDADRQERAEARADRLEERADRLGAEAAAREETARSRADMIPLGQPILTGHHSEKRDRNFRAKIRAGFDKAHELREDAAGARGAAHAARATVRRAEDPGAILRRIDRLEAAKRSFQRELAGREEFTTRADLVLAPEDSDPTLKAFSDKWACPDGPRCPDPECLAENVRRGSLARDMPSSAGKLVSVRRFPDAERKRELDARIAAIRDEVGHLRSKLPAELPGPKDFQKGDLVAGPHGECRVERVNARSLSVVPLRPQWPGQKYLILYDRRPRLLGQHPGPKS